MASVNNQVEALRYTLPIMQLLRTKAFRYSNFSSIFLVRPLLCHNIRYSSWSWLAFFQRRRSSSDIEVAVYPRPDDVRYRTLSTDRPGGQPISDPEDLRRPIRPHYANFSELHMSTDFQVSVRVLASSHSQPAPFLHNPSLI